MADGFAPRRLAMRMVDKVWGRDLLPAPFAAPDGRRIGEIWFEPAPEMPQLLVKYLFTSEKLSVQVHPSAANAQPGEAGKDECWLVLGAAPGARLAIGFEREVSCDAVAAAARDGSIEDLLAWHSAKAGDLFYLPAGTVHAIGPGLALVEVQQTSETTFRLYDYGRPRELHLERALGVAITGPYDAAHRRSVRDGTRLVDGPFFRLDRIIGAPDSETLAAYPGVVQVLPLHGSVRAHDGSVAAEAGESLIAHSLADLDFAHAEVTLLARSI
ncbi:class I mannose-6-phosphate isomerase [Erythrobacter neustonensis]|uniref:Mannose-6-phosphate isomerase n=1 Tax=Erythrobacter neustonensis TaxID=1112 RepID=A0A192D257_9SPHN|nr:class I mannose-6-phosphate isomerase [Erythrobacter neustonensis]ANK12027.1 mannose-6-phosphate isomerase [Erythrobacter neustonensis]